VPKADFSRRNWYDVWYPLLAPSVATMKLGLGAENDQQWRAFASKYRAEMSAPAPSQSLDVLAHAVAPRQFFGGAVTARTRRAAIARCCASCWLPGARSWSSQGP
jgi:uncharacterized protein YeaO (DUF488 family)